MGKASGIYIIINVKNGKVYIGQTVDFNRRWSDHKKTLNKDKHTNGHLQAAWNKYGSKSFKFLKLEYCEFEQLDEREQHHLNIYMAKGMCYNIAKDVRSSMRGRSPSKETRQKQSEAAKRRSPVSEETRQKIGRVSKGIVRSEETRRKMSDAKKGHAVSEETRHKLSEANKNMSEEKKRKISDANREAIKNMSAETRRKLSEAAIRIAAHRRAEREAIENKSQTASSD